MSVRILPPSDRGATARTTWLNKQLENCHKRESVVFNRIKENIMVEADIKNANTHIKVKLSNISELAKLAKGKDINAFHIFFIKGFGAGFASNKKFIVLIEQMVLEF